MEIEYGKGRIVLYGFKPEFRGQAHGTYRYLFNTLYSFDQPELPVLKIPAAAAAAAPEHVVATVKATVEEPNDY